jgi:fatty acid desaturase
MPEEYKGYDRERTEHIEQRNGEVGNTEGTTSIQSACLEVVEDYPDGKRGRFERYSFNPEIRKELRRCFELDNWHGLLELLEDWIIIAAVTLISELALNHWHLFAGVVVYFSAILIIGSRMRALADLLHQSAHRTLAKNKVLNFALGTFPSGYLVLQSFTGYYFSHIKRHHNYLGDPALDPDYIGLQENGLYGQGLFAANVRCYLIRIFHPVTTLSYLRYLLQHRILNRQETYQERLIRIFYLISLLYVLLGLGWGKLVLFYWIIPFVTTANWIGAFIELTEHYPLMEIGNENNSQD